MRAPLFNNNEFLDETSFNNAYGLVTDSLVDITGNLHTPGLINASALSFGYSGLTITIDAPLPFRALFSDGTLASANGTTDGESSSSATVDFSSLVPSTGSVTAYLVAVSGSVLQQPSVQPGPPVGHPDFSPSYQPYTAYAENQDTIQFQATLTAPDNETTLFIASTVLSAGQTVITSSSTTGQVRAGAILSRNGEVLAADLGSGAAASNVGALGGSLVGTLPNPTLAAGAAATNVGTLGGSLVGTLPNPTLASTGATAGTYVNPISITVDSDGRISGISNVDDFDVPGNLTAGGTLTVNGTTSLQSTSVTSLSNSGNATITGTASAAAGTSGNELVNYTQMTNGSLSPSFGSGSFSGQLSIPDATASGSAINYGQAFQLLSGAPPSSITLGNTLHTVAQFTLTASGSVTLEPGSVVGQEITIYGGAYALTVQSNVTSGPPYFVLPDESNVYSWTIPANEYGQGIKLIWSGTNWRARTFGQTVVAPATQNNAAAQLGQFPASLGNPGYQKLASGLIIQWGRYVAADADTIYDVTLPITFPNEGLVLVVTPYDNNATTISSAQGYFVSNSTIGMNVTNANITISYIAIGY